MHSGAQISSVLLRNAGDQVGATRQGQRGRGTAHNGHDFAFQPERLKSIVDRSAVASTPREEDVPAGRVASWRDPAAAQRVPMPHDADKPIPEQRLRPEFGSRPVVDHAGFQIYGPVAKGCAVLVRFLHEIQANAGGVPTDPFEQIRSEILDKTLAGPQREGSDKPREVDGPLWAENRFHVLDQLANLLAEFERPRRGNQTASGPHQERIPCRRPQPRQRPAHGRRTQPQPFGCPCHAAFGKQDIKRDKQVEIGWRHISTIAFRPMASNARIRCNCCVFRPSAQGAT